MQQKDTRSTIARTLLLVAWGALLASCASPLRRAVEAGDAARVSALLDQGAERQENLADGVTPLKIAVNAHRPDMVRFLIARGADVNARRGGISALSVAAIDGDLAMVELLLSKGALAARTDAFWVRGKDSAAIVALLNASMAAQAQGLARRPAAAEPEDARTPPPVDPREDDFALVVGVDDDMVAPAAKSAKADAEAVARSLVAQGWPARNVLTLTGQRASRAGLEKYLERWLPANVRSRGRFLFYFAGNAAVDGMTGDAYLLPWGGDTGMLEQTGYPLTRLYRAVGALGTRGTAVVIDAGSSGSGTPSPAGPAVLPNGAGRCVVVRAAVAGGGARKIGADGHGSFTGALLADLDARGPRAMRELFDCDAAAPQRSSEGPVSSR
jgi:ankyrin repeat protein